MEEELELNLGDMSEFDFSPEELAEYKQSDEYARVRKKRLIENERLMKALKREKISILSDMADPENSKNVFEVVDTVHGEILNKSYDEELADVVERALSDTQKKVLDKNRNKAFMKSGDVFDNYAEHPVQQDLVSRRLINKRLIKDNSTPMKHIKRLYQAANIRLKFMEIDRLEEMVKTLEQNQERQTERLSQLENLFKINVAMTERRFEEITSKLDKKEKVDLVVLILTNPSLTAKELAESLGKSVRTIKYWLKELKDLGIVGCN